MGLVVWYGLNWSWVFFTDMLDLAGSRPQAMVVASIVFAFEIFASVFIIHWFWRRRLPANWHPAAVVAATIGLGALADYAVAWLPTLFWVGPQAQWDSVLPLASPALLLANTPLVFAGRLVGFYGLAGFVWATIFLLGQRQTRRLAYLPLAILVVISTASWLIWRSADGSQLTARVVSETLDARIPAIKPEGEKLVVFPEYGLEKINNSNLDQRLEQPAAGQPKTYFLGSEQIFPNDQTGHINRMHVGNNQDGFLQAQDKYRLIPGGEDLPYLVRIGLRATGQVGTLNYFSYAKGVIRGPKQLEPFEVGDGVKVGAAVCSSIIAPQDYRWLASRGANVFSNSASLGIFQGSPVFFLQQRSFGRFMAVANARGYLQSANGATGYAYTHNGELLTLFSGIDSQVVTVQTNSRHTFYTKTGELIPWSGLLILAYLGLHRTKSKNSKAKKSNK